MNYPFSTNLLALCPNYFSRTAVPPGTFVGPFDPKKGYIKGWSLPTGGSFLFFDATTGMLSQLPPLTTEDAQAFNLPGSMPIVPYVVRPCPVQIGGWTNDASGMVCEKADAQAMLDAIAPLYPGVTLSLVETDQGMYALTYAPGETRREWVIEPIGVNAQNLIAAQNWHGIGLQGSWSKNGASLLWTAGPQVTVAPPGTPILPVPCRALADGEAIEPVTGVLPGSHMWQVTNAQAQASTLMTAIQQLVAQYNALPGVKQILAA